RPFATLPSFFLPSSRIRQWKPRPGSGWELTYRLIKTNAAPFTAQAVLAAITACLFYAPAFFLQRLVKFLEVSKTGEVKDIRWGWAYCAGLFFVNATTFLCESLPVNLEHRLIELV